MSKDYYDVLGVKKDSSQDDIKKAYRSLALQFHPDRNKSKQAEEKFKEINEAYAVLGDTQKRQQYDTMGSEQFGRQFSPDEIFRNFDFESVFKDMGINVDFGFPGFGNIFGFGDQQGAPRRERGQDILHSMDITLEEAAKGAQKEVRLKHVKKCGNCNGSGAEPGSSLAKCPKCGGSGYINIVRNSMFARIQTVSPCDECGGRGKIPSRKCKVCAGKGGVVAYDNIDVTIPHGVGDGMRLRLLGVGDYNRDESGDLYLEIHVLKHKDFERSGDDIIANVSVPFYDALLGAELLVPTLNGAKKVRIEPGTQPGARIVLDGEGIKGFRSNTAGDEIINVNVELPKSLSDSERDLIRKFKESRDSKKKFGLF